jgi:hypothetical protein
MDLVTQLNLGGNGLNVKVILPSKVCGAKDSVAERNDCR